MKIAFLLLTDFSMMAFASLMEPLRSANRTMNKECYAWKFVSVDGKPAASSSGAMIMADSGMLQNEDADVICLVAGMNVSYHCTDELMGWLRQQAVRGAMIGSLSTGTYVLAKAGLLDGKRCTTHWEGLDSFKEVFPDVDFTGSLYEVDGNRFTCAGGNAAFDLALCWIGEQYGSRIKAAVSDQFLHGTGREAAEPQKNSAVERYGIHNEKLLSVVNLMEENLEEPLSRQQLADRVAVTIRQLERLFSKYLGTSPSHFYLRLRLDRARYLLRQTAMPISEIAIACGFVNFSHFARSYRNQFAHSPSEERVPE